MSTRPVLSSTLWQVASQLVMAALSVLTVKFVAMGLSKELAGNYNSAYGYLQLFGILADFGLYAVSVREVSRAGNREQVLGAMILLRSIILVLSLSAALLFVWIFPMWRGTPLPVSVTIAALVPFFTLLAGVLRTIFQVSYRMHYVFIAEVVQRVITTGLIGYFIFLGVRGSTDLQVLHMFLFIGGIGAFVLFLLSYAYGNRLVRIRISWNPALLKRLARLAAPYGVAFLCVALYRQLDTTLIAVLRPDFELQNAYYGFALRATEMGYLLPTFLLNSALPVLSERDAAGHDVRLFLGKTLFSILLISVTVFLFAFLWARPLMQLLTTESYLSAAEHPGSDTALALLSFPMLLNGIILFSFYTLLTRHAWRSLVCTLGCAAVVSIVLNVLLIPRFGFTGAAFTSIIVHMLLAPLLFWQSVRVMPFSLPLRMALQGMGYSAFLGAGLFLLRPFLSGALATVAGLCVISLFLLLFVILSGIYRSLSQ